MPGTAKSATIEEKWTEYAKEKLVGRKIEAVRYLSERETEAMDWYSRSLVIILDDRTILFPSRDDEGNDAGALFGEALDGEELTFPVI